MSDFFYDIVWAIGTPAFWTSGSPVVLGLEHTRRTGPFIVAANHTSPYDVALLIRHSKRRIDFVSIVEVFRNPFVAWFYGSMNAFPLDRSQPDAPTVRIILDRLERGRVVGMFPEGRFRRGRDSVFVTRRITPGLGRIAKLSGVPIVPCVIENSIAYSRFTSWLPWPRTRYGMHFGPPIEPLDDPQDTERRLVDELVRLHDELLVAMRPA